MAVRQWDYPAVVVVRGEFLGRLTARGIDMAWVRTISFTSKLPFAECLKHFKSNGLPAMKESPATSMQWVQTAPNSGLFILQFENKRALNQHEKMTAGAREKARKALKARMTIYDGQVKWSR